ncbi:aspartate aminotransferase [Aspergillus sclerotioniger CBS 115572]|uniref:Aspartate aminotransferase n=1 Tax=Aspergillus sclerotioniger CBS 115572 TaxID=1450535 RepID=A0A317W4W2_9EURO|nr:aspartate aminotransferase [Aspergillus sclerotioniger CBS 115572]PWY81604.1 aspartate aminotransferase [Aspergillus sclerotioniger CBS 115572]
METTSARGRALAAQKPTFLDVLGDLWDPHSNPNGIVNLGLAENTLMHAEMKEFCNANVQIDAHALTYGDGFSGSHRLKKAMSQFLNRYFSPWTALHPSDLAITSGVSNALECCAWALADAGDHILVGRPYSNAFKTIYGSRPGIELVEVSFGTTDPFSMAAIDEYERAYAAAKSKGLRIRAVLLCSPHNPLGRCYSEKVLKGYMRFCSRNGLHLISDEIYAMSVWKNPRMSDAPGFKSILSMDVREFMDPSMVHVVWGLSKDFGSTGLRIGCLVSPSNRVFLEAVEGISLYNFPSSVGDQLASRLLLDDIFTEQYISINQHRLAESYQYATEFLRSHNIPYLECNAAFFIWMNLGAVMDATATDQEILAKLREDRVYIAPGTVYAGEEPGWFRLVFGHPPHVLEEGLSRMVRAIQSENHERT